MTVATPPRLFDRRLMRARSAQAAGAAAGVLARRLAEDLADRLALVRRGFETALICGPLAAGVAARLSERAKFGQILIAGPNSDGDAVIDEETLPFAPESLDCIVSLLSLHGVNDLPGALVQMRRALRPDGLLLACLFGGRTLEELRAAWLLAETELRGGASPRVAPMADLRDLGGLVQRAGFALPVSDVDRIVVRYPEPLSLMREIKALGLANALADRSRSLVSPDLLGRAAAAYAADFSDPDGRIRATLDLIWLTGWAPHESQQQPQKPGSARMRLADALKARLPPG